MKLQTTADPKSSAQPSGPSFQVKLPDGGSGRATKNTDGTMTVTSDRGSVKLSKEQVGQIATGDMSSLKPLTAANAPGAGNNAAASAKGKPGDPVMPGSGPAPANAKPLASTDAKNPVLPADAKIDPNKSGSVSNNMSVMSKTGSAAGNAPPDGTVTFNGTTAICNPGPCNPALVYRAGNGAYAGADVTISSTGAATPTTMTTTSGGITSTITAAGSAQQTTTLTVGGQTYTVDGGGPTTLSGNIGGQQITETRSGGVSTTTVGGAPVVTCGFSTCTVNTPTNVAASPVGGSSSVGGSPSGFAIGRGASDYNLAPLTLPTLGSSAIQVRTPSLISGGLPPLTGPGSRPLYSDDFLKGKTEPFGAGALAAAVTLVAPYAGLGITAGNAIYDTFNSNDYRAVPNMLTEKATELALEGPRKAFATGVGITAGMVAIELGGGSVAPQVAKGAQFLADQTYNAVAGTVTTTALSGIMSPDGGKIARLVNPPSPPPPPAGSNSVQPGATTTSNIPYYLAANPATPSPMVSANPPPSANNSPLAAMLSPNAPASSVNALISPPAAPTPTAPTLGPLR